MKGLMIQRKNEQTTTFNILCHLRCVMVQNLMGSDSMFDTTNTIYTARQHIK